MVTIAAMQKYSFKNVFVFLFPISFKRGVIKETEVSKVHHCH